VLKRYFQEELEDTKREIRIRKSKKVQTTQWLREKGQKDKPGDKS